jgi:hypothetical protein
MKMKRSLLIIIGLFGLLHGSAFAQNINIDFIEFVGRNIVVHYTLDDGANSNRQFLVQLYSSQDNFSTPLTRVSGDFGTEVTAGFDKKIVWDITKELGAYEGTISLELRGRVYVPFVKLSIKENQVFTRGKNYPLNWTSGNLSGLVNIELYNSAGERIWGENNIPNVGKFDWYLPASVKKGSNYRLKFTNVKDRNDAVFSQPIAIKPKIPFLVKLGAGILLTGATAYVISIGNASNEPTPYATPISPR